MTDAGPEFQRRWLALHDSVTLGPSERRSRATSAPAGSRQWRLHSHRRPQHCPLDEGRLHRAVWDDCREQVQALLEHGVPVNCQDALGWTAVHHAAFCGHLELLRLLLCSSQAEVNRRDFFGCTPLHRACLGGDADTTEYLLHRGASHEARSDCGQTPLHLAAAGGHLNPARALLQHLAAPDPRDSHGWTPLHWAVFGGRGDMAELLLDNGADVEGAGVLGPSPLQLAVMVSDEAGVRLLLHRGADTNLPGCGGRTALHLCARSAEKKHHFIHLPFPHLFSSSSLDPLSPSFPHFPSTANPAPHLKPRLPRSCSSCWLPGQRWERETWTGPPRFTWQPAPAPGLWCTC
ncbi:ankyrin repeat domain-containing protein isoform X2 [Brachyhypopomus gauderio]|uniref:ankyrin repeat domain-containing protein isoform X2 n=1 Tax=Brachyhypopomus gauderio TaxID=698409 RepID=UPI0040429862